MRNTLVILLLVLSSCAYQSYIQVTPPAFPIPSGSKEFVVKSDIEQVLNAVKKANILYSKSENGYQTDEFLIDEGTRGKFIITEFEGTIKVVPYWGITDRVRQNTAMMVGYGAAIISTNEWKRVSYNTAQTRPKLVFDYAVQIFSPTGKLVFN